MYGRKQRKPKSAPGKYTQEMGGSCYLESIATANTAMDLSSIEFGLLCWTTYLASNGHIVPRLKRPGVSNHMRLHWLFIRLFRRKSKKRSKPGLLAVCLGNPLVNGEFSPQWASYAEIASTWWRHHNLLNDPIAITVVGLASEFLLLWHIIFVILDTTRAYSGILTSVICRWRNSLLRMSASRHSSLGRRW